MTGTTESLGLVKSLREAIEKNKSLFEKTGLLQNTVSKKQESRALVEKELTKLKRPISRCDE